MAAYVYRTLLLDSEIPKRKFLRFSTGPFTGHLYRVLSTFGTGFGVE